LTGHELAALRGEVAPQGLIIPQPDGM